MPQHLPLPISFRLATVTLVVGASAGPVAAATKVACAIYKVTALAAGKP